MLLLAVDGNSLINRAFYGVAPLTSRDGTPTGALVGFLSTLSRVLDERKPDGVCVAFDLPDPTFRHKLDPRYKATRKGMPEDLAVQMPLLKKILSAVHIPCVEQSGYEADDILGTMARICEASGWDCLLLTGDRDSFQLIGSRVTVLFQSGRSEMTACDEAYVRDRYGLSPAQLVDLKALMGDASDNIPGVPGIGEKTALTLIQRFGSLDALYAALPHDADMKPGVREKLNRGRSSAGLCRTLAAIDRMVPLCIRPEDTLRSPPDLEALTEIFLRLDLHRLLEKWRGSPVPAQSPARGPVPLPWKKADPASQKDFAEVLAVFLSSDGRAAICDGREVIVDAVLPRTKLAVHDLKSLLRNGHPVGDAIFDTYLAGWLLDSVSGRYDLRSLAERYAGMSLPPLDNPPRPDPPDGSFSDTAPDTGDAILAMYAEAVWRIYQAAQAELERTGMLSLLKNIELPLCRVLAGMERSGMSVDRGQLAAFGRVIGQKTEELEKIIFHLAGETFNIASTRQLADVLFLRLGLPPSKKNKTGYSTDVEVLEGLRGRHEIIDPLLEYRTLTKLKSTYTDGLSRLLTPAGSVHTTFQMTATATGRLSSTEPNLQNIPVRQALGGELRRLFIPSRPGWVLIDADYSQIELRILAHFAKDEAMRSAFAAGADIHTTTAAQVFGVPVEAVTASMRRSAKAVNFGIVYGISEFSLARDIGTTRAEAGRYIRSYFETYRGVRAYMDEVVERAKKDGYVATAFGRRRYLPELSSGNYNLRSFGERVALNAPIQGTAADIIKLSMIRVSDRLSREGWQARLVLQVHDELLVEAPETEAENVAALLTAEMEAVVDWPVPLVAEARIGGSWYEAH